MLIGQLQRMVGLAWVALLVALLGLVAVNTLGPMLGYQVLIIRGASMSPTIPLGSLVADQPVETEALSVGDVITIRASNDVLYTHRIVAIETSGAERQFQVRGDANTAPDAALVPASAVVGRVSMFAPVLGYLSAMLTLPSGILSILSSLMSLLLGYWLLEDLQAETQREAVSQPEAERQPRTSDPAAA